MVMKSLLRAIGVTLVVAWMFFLVLSYYLGHRPFDSQNILGAATTLSALAIFGLTLIFAAACGNFILRAFTFETALEALVIQVGVGYAVLALFVFLLAFVGQLSTLALWILVIAGLALVFRRARVVWNQVRAIELPRATRGERALAFYISFALGIAFVFALAPPTGWDVLAYHLALPQAMLALGTFPPPSYTLSFFYPSQTEMLFALSMGLGSDTAAQAMHWVYLVMTVGLLLAFCARYFTWRVGWLASALLVGVPSILLLATYAYNDLALMFYTFAGLYWTCRALETQRTRDFVLAGSLAGLTLGEKYTAVFVPLALAALVFFQNGLRVPTRRAMLHAFVVGIVALAMGAPWFLRNSVWMGNPVYPFAFGGAYWDAFRAEWFSRFGTGLAHAPLEWLLTPWAITARGIQGGDFDATIGPLLLALIPFGLLPARGERTRVLRAVVFVAAVLFGFWFLGVGQSKLLWRTRFLFPAFPLFALLAAEGWNRLAQIQFAAFSAQRFAALVIALVLGLHGVSITLATLAAQPFNVLLGIETRQEFLARNLGDHYAMTQWVNENLPADARILALWEPRIYYIERAVEPDPILDRFAHWNFLYGDANNLAAAWRAQGFTHVLIFRAGLNEVLQTGYDPLGAAELQTLQALEANHLRLVYDRASLGLFTNEKGLALKDWETQPYAVYEILK